jgi:hypothetical protein
MARTITIRTNGRNLTVSPDPLRIDEGEHIDWDLVNDSGEEREIVPRNFRLVRCDDPHSTMAHEDPCPGRKHDKVPKHASRRHRTHVRTKHVKKPVVECYKYDVELNDATGTVHQLDPVVEIQRPPGGRKQKYFGMLLGVALAAAAAYFLVRLFAELDEAAFDDE